MEYVSEFVKPHSLFHTILISMYYPNSYFFEIYGVQYTALSENKRLSPSSVPQSEIDRFSCETTHVRCSTRKILASSHFPSLGLPSGFMPVSHCKNAVYRYNAALAAERFLSVVIL